MPTRNVNLTDHLDRFVEDGVTSGRFSNASEVVREGLRLLELREQEEQAKLQWLRGAVQEGADDLAHGRATSVRTPAELKALMGKLRKAATAK